MTLRCNRLSIVILAGSMGLHAGAADFDLDGIEDAYDACPRTPTNIPVDSTGRPFGDFDLDCDVDLSDIAAMLRSFTGPLQNDPVNECLLTPPDCGPNATCVDTEFGYTCECNYELGWFSDCDGVVGCEVDHQIQTNSCATATDLGTFCGDIMRGGLPCNQEAEFVEMDRKTGRTSAWFKATAIGCNVCSDFLDIVRLRFTLYIPECADYHLSVYNSCGGVVYEDPNCGGWAEQIEVVAGSGHTGEFWIQVRHTGGTSCDPWTLTVEGRQ